MKKVELIEGNKNRINRSNAKAIERLRTAAYCRVSTDSEEQLLSYHSQVAHYTDLIESNPDYMFVDIYADEAVTVTLAEKRQDFQRLIADCVNGKIDLVITKSISRFARNTVDTLKYVRLLKSHNVAVFFEKEKSIR